MRCPDCQKMVSYDTEIEPEVQDEQADGTAEDGYTFSCSVRRVLACADCGAELKETTFEFEESIDDGELPKCSNEAGHEFEVESCDASPTERLQDKDRNGKKITSARYMKHMYGVELHVTVKCTHCSGKHSFDLADEVQASAFDEC